VIENLKYINWEVNDLYKDDKFNDNDYITDSGFSQVWYYHLTSSGKSGMLIKLQNSGI